MRQNNKSDPFTYIVDVCTSDIDKNFLTREKYVSAAEYESFQKQWLFDAVAGKRYGQSFCDYFGFGSYIPLYYMSDNTIADKWIKEHYLR